MNMASTLQKFFVVMIALQVSISATAEIKDKHDYLQCAGPTDWNDYGDFSPLAEYKYEWRVKVERHGFAQETLHIYPRLSSLIDKQTESRWGTPVSAKVQYNHTDDGVWYTAGSDIATSFFPTSFYLHVISSFHRPWDNQWIRFYRQFIPKPWESPSSPRKYRTDAFEMRCRSVEPFDK